MTAVEPVLAGVDAGPQLLEVRGLVKNFKRGGGLLGRGPDVQAVSGVDLTVARCAAGSRWCSRIPSPR